MLVQESMAAYLARQEASASQIKAARAGPLTYSSYLAQQDDDQTQATSFGSLSHTVILEPEKFEREYVIEPPLSAKYKVPRASKEYREAKAALLARNPGKTLVTIDDLERAQAMRRSIEAHPAAKRLLYTTRVYAEVTLLGEIAGVPVRVRPDVMTQSPRAIVDLKTTKDPTPRAFRADVRRYGYNLSPWMYTEVARQHDGLDYRFFWVCVSSAPPHHVRVYEAGAAMLDLGEQRVVEGLELIKAMPAKRVLAHHDCESIEIIDSEPWELTEGVDLSETELTFGGA